jgi:integration host factor subunit beta
MFESVIKALKTGDKLEVRGFGSFESARNARVGRNPKTEKGGSTCQARPYFFPARNSRI